MKTKISNFFWVRIFGSVLGIWNWLVAVRYLAVTRENLKTQARFSLNHLKRIYALELSLQEVGTMLEDNESLIVDMQVVVDRCENIVDDLRYYIDEVKNEVSDGYDNHDELIGELKSTDMLRENY